MLLIIIILLLIGLPFGGTYYGDGAYRGAGFGLGGLLLIVLIFLLLTHNRLIL